MDEAISLASVPRACELWNANQYESLLRYLHHPNPSSRFAVAWVSSDSDSVVFAHNKTRNIESAINSTVKSVFEPPERPYAIVLLPSVTKESHWLVWDFDFHQNPSEGLGAGMQRDIRVFIREAEKLAPDGFSGLVEHSGRGWHFWLIADRLHSDKKWRSIRRTVETAAQFSGKPEILPCFGGDGKGCRAPGSSNPNTWHVSREDWQDNRIYWNNLSADGVQLNNKEILLFSCTGSEESSSVAEVTDSGNVTESLAEKWRIKGPSQRHNRLLGMVGEGCFQYGKNVLLEAAGRLHREACPPCKTSLEEHLADFELIYDGAWNKLIVSRLSAKERKQLEAFQNQSEREIFIICQNHARHGGGSFYFSTPHTGKCVGLSFGRVAQIRDTFLKLGIIEKLPGNYIPGIKAYSFRWLIPMLG